MNDLTDEELAELRRRIDLEVRAGRSVVVFDAGPIARALEELDRRRLHDLMDAPETPELRAVLEKRRAVDQVLADAQKRAGPDALKIGKK